MQLVEQQTEQSLLFGKEVNVHSSSSMSSQATILFGREVTTGIKVVVKVYKKDHIKAMLREIRMFTFIEQMRKAKTDGQTVIEIFKDYDELTDGLPRLFAFKVRNKRGEILMADAGKPLSFWKRQISSTSQRLNFACQMLRQIIGALSKIHSFGFSHSDIKMDNICARFTKNGKLKFTLIDFGVSSKLQPLDADTRDKSFRGNFTYASPDHLYNKRASQVDDLLSLLYVAYKFVYLKLPWDKLAKKLAQRQGIDRLDHREFIQMRWDYRYDLAGKIIETCGMLRSLFKQVELLRLDLKNLRSISASQSFGSVVKFHVDYEYLLCLVPHDFDDVEIITIESFEQQIQIVEDEQQRSRHSNISELIRRLANAGLENSLLLKNLPQKSQFDPGQVLNHINVQNEQRQQLHSSDQQDQEDKKRKPSQPSQGRSRSNSIRRASSNSQSYSSHEDSTDILAVYRSPIYFVALIIFRERHQPGFYSALMVNQQQAEQRARAGGASEQEHVEESKEPRQEQQEVREPYAEEYKAIDEEYKAQHRSISSVVESTYNSQENPEGVSINFSASQSLELQSLLSSNFSNIPNLHDSQQSIRHQDSSQSPSDGVGSMSRGRGAGRSADSISKIYDRINKSLSKKKSFHAANQDSAYLQANRFFNRSLGASNPNQQLQLSQGRDQQNQDRNQKGLSHSRSRQMNSRSCKSCGEQNIQQNLLAPPRSISPANSSNKQSNLSNKPIPSNILQEQQPQQYNNPIVEEYKVNGQYSRLNEIVEESKQSSSLTPEDDSNSKSSSQKRLEMQSKRSVSGSIKSKQSYINSRFSQENIKKVESVPIHRFSFGGDQEPQRKNVIQSQSYESKHKIIEEQKNAQNEVRKPLPYQSRRIKDQEARLLPDQNEEVKAIQQVAEESKQILQERPLEEQKQIEGEHPMEEEKIQPLNRVPSDFTVSEGEFDYNLNALDTDEHEAVARVGFRSTNKNTRRNEHRKFPVSQIKNDPNPNSLHVMGLSQVEREMIIEKRRQVFEQDEMQKRN